jgi:ABC-type glycerol-3-phosphate transport system substrate-binding protein
MRDVALAAPPKLLKEATFFEVNPIYVFKGSKHPKEAFELAAFVAGKQYQTAIFSSRSPREDVTSDDAWGKMLVTLTPDGMSYPPVALGQISKAMTDSVGRVLIAGEQPESVARWLAREINRSLKQSGELGGA